MASLKEFLKPLAEDGAALTREQAADVLMEILAGGVPDVEIAALLTVLATRGEQAPELAGFVEVMRQRALPVPLTPEERAELVDVVGTGGGGPLTFNISSGAALVAAAAGAKVAKHGNRAVTSRCGAADVLEALGVPINLSPDLAAECLRATGFMFLYAPLYHPAMKTVGPLRKALGFRTIFNLCGPLTNPAGARNQVIGVLAPSRVLLVARTLASLGAKRAFVVHGTDGIDELTTTGESVVARVEEAEHGPPTLKAARITPEDGGPATYDAGPVHGRGRGNERRFAVRRVDRHSWGAARHSPAERRGRPGGSRAGGGSEGRRGPGCGRDRLRGSGCHAGQIETVRSETYEGAVEIHSIPERPGEAAQLVYADFLAPSVKERRVRLNRERCSGNLLSSCSNDYFSSGSQAGMPGGADDRQT